MGKRTRFTLGLLAFVQLALGGWLFLGALVRSVKVLEYQTNQAAEDTLETLVATGRLDIETGQNARHVVQQPIHDAIADIAWPIHAQAAYGAYGLLLGGMIIAGLAVFSRRRPNSEASSV